MFARNVETNLKCLFLTRMKNLSVRNAARKNRPKKCLPSDFPQGANSNHHQQAPALPARVAVHPTAQLVHRKIMQVAIR